MMKKPTVRSSLEKLARFKEAFKNRFFLRFHMTLILTGVFSSGLIISKLLLEAGIRSMLIRYLIVLVLSYLMFFVFIKLWLLYMRRTSQSKSFDAGPGDGIFIPDGGIPIGSITDLIRPGGGEFGGGGASGDFPDLSAAADVPDEVDSAISVAVAPQSSGSSGLPDFPDIDLDDGGIVLIIIGILLALILGACLYIVYAAPVILSDAAVQVIMASSLYKASKKMDSPDWVGGIFKATWVPFVIVVFLTIIVALIATHYCPGASKLSDTFRILW